MTFSEIVELRGHIIDSYALPRIMDEVMDRGGEFDACLPLSAVE